ncbi:acyl carrier protein [Butyrivibrio sp. AE2032]|uniref:acyl carrier protein n=1 Tax=Butyrivibrio sp. AE2032 TaxID=1458463 RepID=UPI0005504E68|nr:phosphopantetheine-binding protein [Butyrivibrio sp. AE2032]
MADSDNLRENVKKEVIRIMSETLEMPAEEITSDLNFNTDLPFDSLQLYEFVIDVEETYNIRLPDELLDEVKTVDQMVDVVMKLTAK